MRKGERKGERKGRGRRRKKKKCLDGEKIEGHQRENRREREKPVRKILKGKRGPKKSLHWSFPKNLKYLGLASKIGGMEYTKLTIKILR